MQIGASVPRVQVMSATWTLVRHARRRMPVPVASQGMHADVTTGAIAVCDPRLSLRLLEVESSHPHHRPFEVPPHIHPQGFLF